LWSAACLPELQAITKVFEMRVAEELTEAWLLQKLGFFT